MSTACHSRLSSEPAPRAASGSGRPVHRRRDPGTRRLVTTALVVVVVLALACGHRTDLPHESGGGIIPASGTYIVKQIWTDFADADDIILTSGSQVFVSFPAAGQVVGYFSTGSTPRPNGRVLQCNNPTSLAEGLDRTLIVADSDSLGEVVLIFDQATGEQVSAIRDTSWVEIGGVAADQDGHIYVSDRQLNLVRKYDGAGTPLLDLADEGDGAGYVRAPDGLDWQPDRLLVVDSGKQWIQALDTDDSNQALFFLMGVQSPFESFGDLTDVAGDPDGNFYVVDLANATVLKYDDEYQFDQRVELNATAGMDGYLLEPVAVTASARLVYVLDRADGKIVAFELDQ